MDITSDNINDIKERAIQLWVYCGLNAEDYDTEDYINEGDEVINFSFPGDEDCVQIGVDDLINITSKLDTYEECGESTVRCANLSQTVIDIEYNWYYDGEILNEIYETDCFIASIVEEPILIGIRNLRHDCYNYDFWSPCRVFHAIEFRYKEGVKKLPYEQELEEIYRFLFTLNVKNNYLIRIAELPEVETGESMDDIEETDLENYDFTKETEKIVHHSSDLPNGSPMLKMYLDALSISDRGLRFLLFYKIIEYISPIIANSILYKRLEARLNIGVFSKKGESFYNSIVDLVHRYNRSISDAELASTVLTECCDIELTRPYIPDSIWKLMLRDSGVAANRKIEDLTNDDIAKLNISLGKILYATRNSIVHAKSNYTVTGKECPTKDIGTLNEFMKILSYVIIMHNNNLG